MHTKNNNRKQEVVPKQLQKQILEENHSGIVHVTLYRYKKFHILITILILYCNNQYNDNIAHHYWYVCSS